MGDLKGNKNRRNLSLFATNDHNNNNNNNSPTTKSPKSFKPNGVVGLGIVAAMNELNQTHDPFFSAKSSRSAILAISPKSNPIPIFSPKMGGAAAKFAGPNLEEEEEEEEEEMELSEEYTCVISHLGNNLIKKREYYDGVLANESETTASDWVVSASPPPPPAVRRYGHEAAAAAAAMAPVVFPTADFLNSCYLCKKLLHGRDIFMYRGEKAFCSVECRCKQMSMDERKEKFGSGAMKPLDYSVSPCSSPMQFFAGVAAA